MFYADGYSPKLYSSFENFITFFTISIIFICGLLEGKEKSKQLKGKKGFTFLELGIPLCTELRCVRSFVTKL